MDADRRMIEAQGRRISDLMNEVSTLRKKCERLQAENDRLLPAATFYMQMQSTIRSNEAVLGAWEYFLAILRLSMDDDDPLRPSER